MNRPVAIVIVGAAAAAVLLYALGRWDAAVSRRGDEAIVAAKAWLAAGNARRAERARLLAIAAEQGRRAAQLVAEARAHVASDTVLDRALERATSAVDSLPIVLAQRDSARAAVASWAQAFAAVTLKDRADSVRADRAETALDSAEIRMRNLLAVADCHWLGVKFLPKCLSRTASFVVGAAGGAAAVGLSH